MGFRHPALNDVAAGLADLRSASAKVGGSDPVTALRRVDCMPDAVRDSATAVGTGAEQESDADSRYAAGTASADANWDGAAAAAYLVAAGKLGADRRSRHAAAEDTAAAGQRIADGLDALARSTATQAATIAGEADPDVQTVLHPPTLPGGAPITDPAVRAVLDQRMAEATARVRQACTAVEESVQRAVDQIDDLATGLDGLTEPVVTS